MATLLSISLLWTISGQGVATLLPAAVWCLSGMVIPLPLLPDWVQPILWVLPFRGMMDIPFRIYMGNIPPGQWALMLGQQAAWTAGLICLGRWVLRRGLRRLVVQGG
jgi:ABC-2 type transport system permease protein